MLCVLAQQRTTFRELKIMQAMIDSLLDGFFGNLTSSKWAKMTKISSDTALRDIQDLINKGMLIKEQDGGRSTNYSLVIPVKQ